MALPNLLCIGAQKCGTTGLYYLLDRHPDCVVGTIKESHFFVDDGPVPFGRWNKGLAWYESLYPREARVVADVCPSYSNWPTYPGVAERAASVLPDATIVYLVRDPIDRIVSHWRHWIWRGYETLDFEAALRAPNGFAEYIALSRYGAQLQRWTDLYPADRVIVMHQQDVRAGAQRLFDHFGLPPAPDGGVEANRSDAMRVERLPALPERLRRLVPRALRWRAVPQPDVSDELLGWLLSAVGDDVVAFEQRTGVNVLTAQHRAALAR